MQFNASIRSKEMRYAVRDIVIEAKKLEKKGKKIYWLNIGDPLKYDFRTPMHLWNAVEAHKREAESYAPADGIPEAREAIARDYRKKGISVQSQNVMIGNGLSELIWIAMGVLANPGDNVLLPIPNYPLYDSVSNYLNIEKNNYCLCEENDWQPDTNDLRSKINKKTKAIVVINPNNPTGANYSRKTLKEIADIAAENKLVVLADEIYSKQTFKGEKHEPFASLAKDIAVLSMNGLSKNFFATGFRIGWIAANDFLAENSDIMDAIFKMGRGRLCAVHPFQYTIKAALEGPKDFLKQYVSKIEKRQAFSSKRLNEINGISCVAPKATFYAFPRIELPIQSDRDFVFDLLREEGVCVVFGSGFGQKKGTHHFRIVSLPSIEILGEAFDRLESFVKKHYS